MCTFCETFVYNFIQDLCNSYVLTFIVIFGGDGEYGVLDVFIFVDLRLVQLFVEIRWVVILVSDPDADEFSHWKKEADVRYTVHIGGHASRQHYREGTRIYM